ncbi:enoyl-CoA hydratase-related protein [Pseudonocardia sp. NPDC049154]|uniref:enoyl-CoA hydratase/isomerase family protein n=1 Tax=Pseudonocardia sp. NPDC049154 TaxID=3155501 RepID=UPI0033C035DE
MNPADLSEPFDDLLYERDGHIARITLNRPDRGNALTGDMQARARAIWDEVRDDPEIRVAIVTATGERHFSTGADVNAVATNGRVSAGDGPMTDEVFWSPHQNRVWKPVITAVNGLVNGGGLHLVVDSDIVVASTNASFMDTHVNVGMVGAIENIGLTKRLPMGTALRMTLQGKNFRLSAERAYQLGLVDELVAPEDLLSTAEQIAADIVKNSPHAVSLSKQALWSAQEMGYKHAMEYGWALLRMHWAHPDFAEGPKAFAERREPKWTT